jgi:plasmid stability protein
MKRTTVMLPDDVEARLRVEAAARGISLAEAVREAIDRGLASQPRAPRRSLSFVGAGDGPDDLSSRADDHLHEIFEARHARRRAGSSAGDGVTRPDDAR